VVTVAPLRVAYALESAEVSGGVAVVLLQAEHLARRGHRVTIVSPDAPPSWRALESVRWERSSFRESQELHDAQVAVATFWTTVEPVLDRARGAVFHLCQGYEGELSVYRDSWERIERVYRLPARKLAVSRALTERLARRGIAARHVGQAFDSTLFTPHSSTDGNGQLPGRPWVLVVGPFESHSKGVDVALEGLRRWRERGGEFFLRRVSELPPSEAERRILAADEFHHRLPPERMPFAYRASQVFLGASREEEGFGLPGLEALCCGVPSLLSDTPGQHEIGGDAAFYFAAEDPEALAAALPEMRTDAARRRARELGPGRAEDFSPERVARALEEAFAEAAS
jgi:glycosyltransferase involved in cell wall biosynthesis